MEKLHIVTVTNDSFAKHSTVLLYSLLENKVSKNPVQIYMIYGKLSGENKSRIDKALDKFNVNIEFFEIDRDLYKDFKIRKHLTSETYYRYSISDLLNKKVKRVLYLDSDMIVKDDVTRLWDLDLSKHVLAAVEDPGHTHLYKDPSLPVCPCYFNAGMLFINLKKWRKQHITRKLFQYTQEKQSIIRWPSQDPLNAVLYNNWVKLDPMWNFQVYSFRHLAANPSIIHYNTSRKPWKHKTPLKEEYDKVAAKVVWE